MITVYDKFGQFELGTIQDTLTEEVTEELNGQFELYVEMPTGSADFLEMDQLLEVTRGRVFRIYDIRKRIGRVIINARHIVYDYMGVVVKPFQATSASDTCVKIWNNTVPMIGAGMIYTDITSSAAFEFGEPKTLWSLMRDVAALYGGEWEYTEDYQGYTFFPMAVLLAHRGFQEARYLITYSVDITDFELTDDYSEQFSAILPFYQANGKNIVYGTVIDLTTAPGIYKSVKALNFKDYFDHEPTVAELNTTAAAYVAAHPETGEKHSVNVRFVTEADNDLQKLNLGDAVLVENKVYGYTAELRVVKTVRNLITGLYKSIELGEMKTELTDTIATSDAQIAELDNNKLSAAPVLLASSSSTAVTELDMTPGFVNENFHTFYLVCRNILRQVIAVPLPRVAIPTTTDSRYSDDTNFRDYAHLAQLDNSAYALFKIDLLNWKCKIQVGSGYIGEIYGLR